MIRGRLQTCQIDLSTIRRRPYATMFTRKVPLPDSMLIPAATAPLLTPGWIGLAQS